MTALPSLANYGIKDLDKFFVGFDETFNRLAKFHDDVAKNIPNYPPYNIKKVDDNKYVIELAVAGFSKNELELELSDGVLTVKGNTSLDSTTENALNQTFLYKGISDRSFTRKFNLADAIEIQNAEYLNGMLKVFLERIIPEHKKPRKIEIKDQNETGGKKSQQLLTEDK